MDNSQATWTTDSAPWSAAISPRPATTSWEWAQTVWTWPSLDSFPNDCSCCRCRMDQRKTNMRPARSHRTASPAAAPRRAAWLLLLSLEALQVSACLWGSVTVAVPTALASSGWIWPLAPGGLPAEVVPAAWWVLGQAGQTMSADVYKHLPNTRMLCKPQLPGWESTQNTADCYHGL